MYKTKILYKRRYTFKRLFYHVHIWIYIKESKYIVDKVINHNRSISEKRVFERLCRRLFCNAQSHSIKRASPFVRSFVRIKIYSLRRPLPRLFCHHHQQKQRSCSRTRIHTIIIISTFSNRDLVRFAFVLILPFSLLWTTIRHETNDPNERTTNTPFYSFFNSLFLLFARSIIGTNFPPIKGTRSTNGNQRHTKSKIRLPNFAAVSNKNGSKDSIGTQHPAMHTTVMVCSLYLYHFARFECNYSTQTRQQHKNAEKMKSKRNQQGNFPAKLHLTTLKSINSITNGARHSIKHAQRNRTRKWTKRHPKG